MKYALHQKFFGPWVRVSDQISCWILRFFFASWSPIPILGSMKAFFWHSTLAHFSKRHSTFRQKFSRPSTFKIQLDTQYWSLEFSCFGVVSMKKEPTIIIKMQFSNLRIGHGLFDPLIVTFQGQTFFCRVCCLRTLIPKILFVYEGP